MQLHIWRRRTDRILGAIASWVHIPSNIPTNAEIAEREELGLDLGSNPEVSRLIHEQNRQALHTAIFECEALLRELKKLKTRSYSYTPSTSPLSEQSTTRFAIAD